MIESDHDAVSPVEEKFAVTIGQERTGQGLSQVNQTMICIIWFILDMVFITIYISTLYSS
jgi:hypothetical protein